MAVVSNEGERALGFCTNLLTHTKGEWAGQPLRFAPWQRNEVILPLFGEKRADGTRRYRRVYVEVARKNGKSTMAAAIALLLLFADGELGAEVYSVAADRFQAGIVFGVARRMVETNPWLSSNCLIYRRAIYVPSTDSVYQVLSADVKTKHGLNASGVIFDELHTQPNRDLWDVLTTSTAARRQPVTLAITTAGYDRHSVCYEQHAYAQQVAAGIIPDKEFLPVIHAADPKQDWTKPAAWAKANPNLGTTPKIEYIKKECKRAQQLPGFENTFKRLHLNIWTEQDVRWMKMEKWDACDGAIKESELLGQRCYAGIDLASTTDICALVLLFPLPDGRFATRCNFWIPRENIKERVARDHVPYDVWLREGWIEATEGNVVDYDAIRARVNELGKRYNILEIPIDRWNSTSLQTDLAGDGFSVVQFGQGFASMSAPTKELEKLVLSERILHGGNPVLRWMASNVAVKTDPAGNQKPDKGKSTEKIDGIVALIMAVGRAISQAQGGSVYEERGILTL